MAHEADPSPGEESRGETSRGDTSRARARLQAALDEQKRSFLRMVSHELRTPLNSILGFSEILSAELYGPLGAPQYKDYAAIIHGSGQKLLKLVNQVLEIARLEGRTMDFDPRPESVEAALDDVLAMLKPDLEARGLAVEVAERERLPLVLADPRGLRSVLFQLLHNAATFSPDGGTIRVRAETHDGQVQITIADEGEGVDPAQVQRLMAPFEQGENALTRKSEGAGLGLSIADLTCKAMDGRLRLSAAPDHGLCATIRLPAG